MTITLTAEQTLELLQRAVDEKGAAYVYPAASEDKNGLTCQYVRDGAPSCIVGHVINYLNPELLPEIAVWERSQPVRYGDGTAVIELITEIDAHLGGITIDELAISMLESAQGRQDFGNSWGEALDGAARIMRDEKGLKLD